MEISKFLLQFLKNLKWFLLIPLYLLVFITLTVVPILLIPLFIYRFSLKKCFKWFRPDLANMLTCGNTIMTSYDQVYGRNDNTTVIALTVAGNLDIDHVRQVATEKLINAKTKEGILKYPELKQFPVKWMGYYFWKSEPNFDIRSHVEYYALPEEGKFYNDDDAATVEAELVTKSHIKENSPWQIIILPNFKSKPEDLPRSIVYFRTHHGLMDGYALFQLIVGDLGGVDLTKLGITPISSNWLEKLRTFLSYCVLLFKLPFDIPYYVIIPSLGYIQNDLRLNYKDLAKEQVGTRTLQIPLAYIKEIRKVHNVSFGSVITAAWIGGIRRTMLNQNMKIPGGMYFGYPLPIPGHPGKLRVHASALTLTFPIGTEDPVQRLKSIDRYLTSAKKSTAASGLFAVRGAIGSMLPVMIDTMIPYNPPTGSMNIFVGTTEPFPLFGPQVDAVNFSYGQQKFRNSVLFSSLTFCDNVYMKIAFNKNVLSRNPNIDKINSFILEELDFISKHGIV